MTPELEARINNFMGAGSVSDTDMMPQSFQEGGEVEQMMMMAEGDPNAELAAAIDGKLSSP